MILRWIAGVLCGAALAALLALLWLLGTGAGTALLVRQAIAVAPGKLEIDGLDGSVLAGISATALRYELGTTTVSARGLRLQWRPAALAGGRLHIAALTADAVALSVLPGREDKPRERFAMPQIVAPLPITVERLEIGELAWQSGETRQVWQRLALAASLDGSQLAIGELRGAIEGVELQLAGEAQLTAQLPLRLQLQWRMAEPALSGTGGIEGNLARLTVQQRVTSMAGDGQLLTGALDISGVLEDPANALRAQAVAKWDELQIAAAPEWPVTLSAGEIELSGDFDRWSARLQTRLRTGEWPELAAAGAFDGLDLTVQIRQLQLSGVPGTLRAKGLADFSAGPRVRLEIDASGLDPAALRADLRGRLAAQLTLDAVLPDRVGVRLRALRGTFMDRPVAGSASVEWTGTATAIDDLRLRAGPNELRASGRLGETLAGRFAIDAPELGLLWPGLHGRLTGSGTLAGTAQRPQAQLAMAGEGLQLDATAIRSLSLDANIDRAGRVAVQLRTTGITAAGQPLGDLRVTASGDFADHEITARLSDGPVAFDLRSRGAWDGRALRHRLTPATLAAEPLGEWQLAAEAPWEFRDGAVTVGDHCWTQGAAALCLRRALWSGARSALAAELRGLSVEPYGQLLGADVAIAGTVAADLDFEQDASGVAGRLSWRQDGTTFYYTGGDEPIVLGFPVVRLDVTATRELANLQAELRGEAGIALRAGGALTNPFADTGELSGEVQGELPDISAIVTVLTADWDLADVAGRLALDARVSGTVAAPRVTGALALRDGAFALPDTGMRIEDIQLIARGDDTATLTIEGTARSGGGLRIDGEIEPLGAGGPSGVMRVEGSNVEVLRIPDRYVQASPRVVLRYENGRIGIEGVVDVPKADIVVRALPASAASPSADAVVRDRPVAVPPPAGPEIGGALQINFGREVRLRAFGLDTRLTGGIRLSQTPEGAVAGNGVVRLDAGKFGAYGKELTIDRGALIFNGPLDDPAFDVRASRRVDYEGRSVTAGLLLSGTARRPESRVFSEPAMGEADALSYLIAGKPLSSAGAEDQSAIGGAALALGLRQASPITEQIGGSVALDEFGVEGSELEETQLIAGKQINPDLYLRFAYGLFNRIGTVLARYRIGRNLSIEAASGEDQSLDLVWSAERD